MKPFDEADHIENALKQMGLLYDADEANDRRLKLVERLRERAISELKLITPQGLDLKKFIHANYLYGDLSRKQTPEIIPFQGALNLLRECTSALEAGKVGQRHIELIPKFYAALDPRLTSSARGRANRIKHASEEKAKARKLASEISAEGKDKPLSIRELWRQVTRELYPELSGRKFLKMADNLRNQNKGWKPPD